MYVEAPIKVQAMCQYPTLIVKDDLVHKLGSYLLVYMCFVEVLNAHFDELDRRTPQPLAPHGDAVDSPLCSRTYVAFDDVAVTGYALLLLPQKQTHSFINYTKHNTSSGLEIDSPMHMHLMETTPTIC